MIHNINKKLASIVFIAMLSAMVYISVTSSPITFATVTSGSGKVVKLPIKYTAGNGNYTDTLPASGANRSWILSANVNTTFTYLNTSLVGPLTITSFTGSIYANDTAAVKNTNMTYGLWDSNDTLIKTGNVTSSISNVATAAITLTALSISPAAVIPAGREFYFTLASNQSTTQISFNSTTYPSHFNLTLTDHLSINIATDKAAGSTYKKLINQTIWEPINRTITATSALGFSDIVSVRSYFWAYNIGPTDSTKFINDTTTTAITGVFSIVYTYADITNKTYASQWWYPTAILTDQSGNTLTEPDSAADRPNHHIYMSAGEASPEDNWYGPIAYFIENNTLVFALFLIVIICCAGGAIVALSSTRIAGKRR